MVPVLSSDDTIQDVVCAALDADHAEVDAHIGLVCPPPRGVEFPQATIMTLSLSALLEAAHTSGQSLDE